MKKSTTGTLDLSGAASKRWSAVKKFAAPYLFELTSVAKSYNIVLVDASRWKRVTPVSLCELSDELSNENLAKALPEITSSVRSIWAAAHATCMKQLLDAELSAPPPLLPQAFACANVFAVVKSPGGDGNSEAGSGEATARYFLHSSATFRSQIMLAELSADPSGRLALWKQESAIQFISSTDMVDTLYPECEAGCLFSIYAVQVMPSPSDGGAFGLLPLATQPGLLVVGDAASSAIIGDRELQLVDLVDSIADLPLLQLRPLHTVSKAMPPKRKKATTAAAAAAGSIEGAPADDNEQGDDEAGSARRDREALLAGDEFGEEVLSSDRWKSELDLDLDEENTSKKQFGELQTAFGANGKHTLPSARAIDQAINILKGRTSDTSDTSAVPAVSGATRAELEEEALLLVLRFYGGHKNEALQAIVSNDKPAPGAIQPDLTAVPGKLGFFDSDCDCDSDSGSGCSNDGGDEPDDEAGIAASPAAPARVKLPKQYQRWFTAMVSTLDALTDWATRREQPLGHQIAIVVSFSASAAQSSDAHARSDEENAGTMELMFVKWADVLAKEGGICQVDANDRVKFCPTHIFGKFVETHFILEPKYEVLMPAAGACSTRYKGPAGALRDKLPDAVARFVLLMKLLVSYTNKDSVSLN